MNGISALIEETPGELAGAFHPKEAPGEVLAMNQGEGSHYCAIVLALDLGLGSP